MTKRSATHATFVIEREFPHPPAKVFSAYSNAEAKAQWFGGPADWQGDKLKLDFRVGGRESVSGRPPGGAMHRYNALYWDIVDNARIVLSYEMHLDDTRISVSLATTEFKPTSKGTLLALTEQGVFLDGYDDAGQREQGTRELLDQLERFLNR